MVSLKGPLPAAYRLPYHHCDLEGTFSSTYAHATPEASTYVTPEPTGGALSLDPKGGFATSSSSVWEASVATEWA
jgi:hypothetical protein